MKYYTNTTKNLKDCPHYEHKPSPLTCIGSVNCVHNCSQLIECSSFNESDSWVECKMINKSYREDKLKRIIG